jgi:dipeptidase E
MKLFLYSDQVIDKNEKIDQLLIKSINKLKPKVGYIPACGDKDRRFYNERVNYYKKYDINNFMFFDLDQEYDESKTIGLLQCDAIHLSGGDPVYFNNSIKRRNFTSILRRYVKNGGILIGNSGGSMQMTKSVASYKLFTDGLTEALTQYENLRAMELVEFEFLPHLNRHGDEFISKVKEYSRKCKVKVYGCNDGDGIIINDDRIEIIGDVTVIE